MSQKSGASGAQGVSGAAKGPRTKRKGVEDAPDDSVETETSPRHTNSTGSQLPNRSNAANTELPPNENLRKDSDEAYGDTEIPERKGDL
jgi:hypothetical protein